MSHSRRLSKMRDQELELELELGMGLVPNLAPKHPR